MGDRKNVFSAGQKIKKANYAIDMIKVDGLEPLVDTR